MYYTLSNLAFVKQSDVSLKTLIGPFGESYQQNLHLRYHRQDAYRSGE